MFTPDQHKVIRGLARGLMIVGVGVALAGMLGIAAVLRWQARSWGQADTAGVKTAAWALLIPAALALSIGGLAVGASAAFRRTAGTEEDGVGHLMRGLDRLRILCYLLAVPVVLALGYVVLVFFAVGGAFL